jgi:hypothetical protein
LLVGGIQDGFRQPQVSAYLRVGVVGSIDERLKAPEVRAHEVGVEASNSDHDTCQGVQDGSGRAKHASRMGVNPGLPTRVDATAMKVGVRRKRARIQRSSA